MLTRTAARPGISAQQTTRSSAKSSWPSLKENSDGDKIEYALKPCCHQVSCWSAKVPPKLRARNCQGRDNQQAHRDLDGEDLVAVAYNGYPVAPGRLLDFDTRFVPFTSIPENFRSRAQTQRNNSDVVLAMRAPANDKEMNVDGTANWVCYQEAKTEVKTEAKTEEKSKKKMVKTEEKTEEKRKVKIPRTSRQAKNATAKLDFGKESK